MKLLDHLDDFLEYLREDFAENTIGAYRTDLKQFAAFYTGDMEDLTRKHVDDYKTKLVGLKRSPKTINRKLMALQSFIVWVNNTESLGTKLLADVRLMKFQKQEYLEDCLEKVDFDRMVRAAERSEDRRAVALFYGYALTGARASELLQLKVGDIDQPYVSVRGKGNKYRDLFIPPTVWEHIKHYLRTRATKEDDFIFINIRNNRPMDRFSVFRVVKKYGGLARVKLTRAHPHNFRHMYGFRLIEDEGCSESEAKDLLGHSKLDTVSIYTRKTRQKLLKRINDLR